MQVAATQRPHPPPVPPRPSRQVVAEALKRSPRPPCPTRQAPPPPNTRPWRSSDQEEPSQQVNPAVGRTVVYESTKESVPKETGEPAEQARVADGDRGVARDASERNDEDERRGNPRERRHRENSVEASVAGAEKPSSTLSLDQSQQRPTREDPPDSEEPGDQHGSERRFDDSASADNARAAKECEDDTPTELEHEAQIPAKERGAPKPLPPRSSVSFTDELRAASEPKTDGPRSQSRGGSSEVAEGKANARPVPTQRSAPAKPRDSARQRNAETTPFEAGSSANENAKSVPGDRPTVVVVDEAERKAASSNGDDAEDANENNIHRQDWLEAGVRYSSTQITLSGDDADADGDRVNGLDRREDEKVGDLNLLR